MSGNRGVQPRFGPSNRVSELAQHKTSKTVWATAPCGKLNWGTQEPVWPRSASAPGAGPSARIQHLAGHKRDFSAREDHRRKEEASFSRKTRRPSSSEASRYERIVRLSTPRTRTRSRSRGSQEAGRPPHAPRCDDNCPIRHVDPSMKTAALTPRLLRLSNPKPTHPDFRGNRESVASIVSLASRTAPISQRLVRLSLPRLKRSNARLELGRPVEPTWTVSKAALRATASARVDVLAAPKRLSKDYVPPREPEWSPNNVPSA